MHVVPLGFRRLFYR